MGQLHKRFSDDQVASLLHAYDQGLLSVQEVLELLGISRARFFDLLKAYRADPMTFSIAYERGSTGRLSSEAETAIERELLRDKDLIDNPDLPITTYNYSALRDRLAKQGISVSLNTIIDRAKKLGCHQPRKKHKPRHDREVLTSSIGALIQQDGSTHLWSPYATEKWTLITTIDDFSRMLLFADFFSGETTWAHVQASRAVVETFGVPLRWYVNSLRVFRFVQGRDSFWRKHVLQTDDVDTQWGKMMKRLGVDVIYAPHPKPRGKSSAPTAGCRTASSAPAPWRKSTTSTMPGRYWLTSGSATAITRCTPPPERFRLSASTGPSSSKTLSSGRLACRLPIPHPMMSSASRRPGLPMDMGAFPCSITRSGWPTCRSGPRWMSVSYLISTEVSCTFESGTARLWPTPSTFHSRTSESTFDLKRVQFSAAPNRVRVWQKGYLACSAQASAKLRDPLCRPGPRACAGRGTNGLVVGDDGGDGWIVSV